MKHHFSRRAFLAATGACSGMLALPDIARPVTPRDFVLTAAPARLPLVGPPHPETDVWCYDGQIPGPEIRVRQGDSVRVRVENRLSEPTTVHWHGVRLPNAMDGVPHLTQSPISPGETFTYEFACPDAGTFWYHPHQHSDVQIGRGLYGPLIVERHDPLPIDRDITWVLGDWRLLRDASISNDFGNMHDVSHNGRVGNTVTINGRVREEFAVRAGERLRLRLINAANARIFGLNFEGHRPQIIALDGQPVEPHTVEQVILGPAMRVDVVLDCEREPSRRFRVIDSFYSNLEYRLLDIAYGGEPPLRQSVQSRVPRLADNPVPEPDLTTAQRHLITLEGGMMGMMRGIDMRMMMERRVAWAMNGMASTEHVPEPLLTLKRGSSCVLELSNETAWYHPMHLHGHSFRVLSRNGKPTRYREWQDTVLLEPRERAEIAFVADNPGDWMFHCHILEHQIGGMMATIRVL